MSDLFNVKTFGGLSDLAADVTQTLSTTCLITPERLSNKQNVYHHKQKKRQTRQAYVFLKLQLASLPNAWEDFSSHV